MFLFLFLLGFLIRASNTTRAGKYYITSSGKPVSVCYLETVAHEQTKSENDLIVTSYRKLLKDDTGDV